MTITEETTIYEIEIGYIRTDGGTQARAALSDDTVADYARALADGDQFPPVQAVYDGEYYWLTDGFHRLAAHKQAGKETVQAIVEQGSLQDAQWSSYGANRTNALQRSNADKQRAVKGALMHPNGAQRSDGEIARHVGVDRQTVTNWRKRLESSGEISQSETRTGADGRTYSTDKISGRKQTMPEPEPESESEPDPEERARRLLGVGQPAEGAEEIAALPAEPAPAAAPAAPKPEPAPEPAAQLPPRLEIAPAAAPAENGKPSEVQVVMMQRIFERAAELATSELDVVPPYSIRAELVEEQARQLINSAAVKMAASMLSLSATEKTEF